LKKTRLGRTDMLVSNVAFGALPIQRTEFDEAVRILRAAYDGGINYFDTGRVYSDSEMKIAAALSDVRKNVYISTKSMGKNRNEIFSDIETSLKNLKTDYVDVFFLHNAAILPDDDKSEIFEAAKEVKASGKARFIGGSFHRNDIARKSIESGFYDVAMVPFSYVSTDEELSIAELCKKHDVGLFAMKGLGGGLLKSIRAAYAFFEQFENVIPLWGIETYPQLEEFLSFEKEGLTLTDDLLKVIEQDRQNLAGDFCRGCGYCMPHCPVGIKLNTAMRMKLILNRMLSEQFLTDAWAEEMEKITECIGCGQCKAHCPYGLDGAAKLPSELEYYREFRKNHKV